MDMDPPLPLSITVPSSLGGPPLHVLFLTPLIFVVFRSERRKWLGARKDLLPLSFPFLSFLPSPLCIFGFE